TSVDASAARARPGVVAVYTAGDLGDYWRPGPLLVPPPPIAGLVFNACTQVPLAKDKLRHVGEPIAMVVAESRYLAEDALDDIVVEADPLPAVVDLEAALAPGAPRVHDQLPSNLAAHAVQRKGDWARAKGRAHAVIKRWFRYDRGASAAIENRAVAAQWDPRAEELTVWDTTQAPTIPTASPCRSTASAPCSAPTTSRATKASSPRSSRTRRSSPRCEARGASTGCS